MTRFGLVFMLAPMLATSALADLCSAAAIASLEDIEFWVGTGSKRAALLVDWHGDSQADNALGWGFRWDGTATGEDMFIAIVASDPRLYVKIGNGGASGPAVYGLGYDQSNDGQFSLDDGTAFDSQGIAVTGPADGAVSNDSQDLYAEGWFLDGFWHYSTAATNPFSGGAWSSSSIGLSSRILVDDGWDSFAFTPTFSIQAFAANPLAAPTPFDADFDGDQDVDGVDFLAWQRGFGTASDANHSQGDADFDGDVDNLDLELWSSLYGIAPYSAIADGALQGAVLVVPEPLHGANAFWAVALCPVFFRSFRFATRSRFL